MVAGLSWFANWRSLVLECRLVPEFGSRIVAVPEFRRADIAPWFLNLRQNVAAA